MGSCVCASVPVCGRVVCLFFLLPSPFLLLVFSPWLAARNSFWIASCPYRCCGVRGVHARCCPYLCLSVPICLYCPYLSASLSRLSLSFCWRGVAVRFFSCWISDGWLDVEKKGRKERSETKEE